MHFCIEVRFILLEPFFLSLWFRKLCSHHNVLTKRSKGVSGMNTTENENLLLCHTHFYSLLFEFLMNHDS